MKIGCTLDVKRKLVLTWKIKERGRGPPRHVEIVWQLDYTVKSRATTPLKILKSHPKISSTISWSAAGNKGIPHYPCNFYNYWDPISLVVLTEQNIFSSCLDLSLYLHVCSYIFFSNPRLTFDKTCHSFILSKLLNSSLP